MRSAVAVGSRITAAALGGYALAHALPVAVGLALPLGRADATLLAMQASFWVYVAAVMWAFAARSAARAWAGLLGPAALAGGLAWWLR